MRITRTVTRKLIYPICLIFASVAMSATTLDAQARELTTFEAYAKMNKEHQDKIEAYVFQKVLDQAHAQNDKKRFQCLRITFLTKYGDSVKVKEAHRLLNDNIFAAVRDPSPKGRVEYLVANHFNEACPKSNNIANN